MDNEQHRGRVAFLTALLFVTFSSCRKEDHPATWDVDVLAPLLQTTFTIADLVPDSLLQADPQGQVTLVYSSELFRVGLDTLLLAPDTSFLYRYGLPVADSLNFPPGINIFGQSDLQHFDLEQVQLRELILKEGRLELRMDNRVNSLIIGSLELPGAVFPDGTTTISASVPAGTPAHPSYSTALRDLAGTSFDLRGPQYNAVNTLQMILGAQLDPNGNGAWVTSDDSLVLSANFLGLVPEYARGYFGQRTVESGPDTNRLTLFDSFVSGTLDLDAATLRMSVENGFGVDLQAHMHQLTAINSRTGSTVDLTHALFQGPMNIDRAIDMGSAPQPSLYSTTIDVNNSNIDLFLESMPDRVAYSLDLDLNPLGDISSGNDFLYHASELHAMIDLEVPLRLITNALTLRNTATPDLPGSAEAHGLQYGTLKLFATNGFPMTARIALDLVDAAGQVVASIPVQGEVAPGVHGPNGLVSQRVDSELIAQLSEDQVDLLYSGAQLRTDVAFTTGDQSQHLRILDSYKMDLQITLAANYVVNGDE